MFCQRHMHSLECCHYFIVVLFYLDVLLQNENKVFNYPILCLVKGDEDSSSMDIDAATIQQELANIQHSDIQTITVAELPDELIQVCSVKSRIWKGHTFFGSKRALFVAKLDSEGTLFCRAAALCRTLTYAVFLSLINITVVHVQPL